MADSYNRHSQSKSTRYQHNEKDIMKSKSRRSKYSEQKYHHVEAKTPPLPTRSTSTLEELLQKRESLKKELKNIVKHSDTGSTKESKKRRHSKEDYAYEIISNKKTYKENEAKSNTYSKRKSFHESSPELDHTQADSEDEESIIELRRHLRKQLIEKFKGSHDTSSGSNESNNKDTSSPVEKSVKQVKSDDTHQNHNKQITDMFSEKDEFDSKSTTNNVTQNNNEANLTDNWDDADGYYKICIGDVINNRYTIKSILGQGVFANVVRAQDSIDGNDYVAIKIVRNNELMYKTSLKEIAILKEIREADPNNKYHCVQFYDHFMHKGHLCLLLESLHMDLRAVIKKYGKNHGINIKALMSYSRQLLLALRLLKKLGIIHADIKPDNILVNERKNVLKLCDFGSAAKSDDNEPTPYLVSRFYRAPEIILGVPYKHGVDIWSAACTIFEMATAKIMFTGSSNNKMLKCFMDLKGKFSSKLVKRGKFKDQHFNYNNNFLLHKKDEFTGREKVVEMSNININRDLLYELKKSYKNTFANEERKLAQLKDLLDKMTMLDSSQRISVSDCLKHPFILEELQKNASTK
ncbi:hypothetical protein PYW08_005654 [Mythimna loreyi]|uniref:Uncharacterized protein n=1 Tax=Mythimna loreyi TaxID=667449 RepID=A0ACC2QH98_9NEOP|nr:hypothetical protein PYW08_005654 [Mythimna loreyi]